MLLPKYNKKEMKHYIKSMPKKELKKRTEINNANAYNVFSNIKF